ncbi:MAG: nucleoside 2-deoxyribosyltransferase [Euryarchaeota archaeon]|nr:nucleoside 2-deoxyribosyltransferase [Euryarchaeota archaeon]
MARIYIAGPLFTKQDREVLERIDAALREAGHNPFLPHRDGDDVGAARGPDGAEDAAERRTRIFLADMKGLERADALVCLLDGPDTDAGTAFEIGWAYAERRPVFALRTDFRTQGPEGAVSLMLLGAADRFLPADEMGWEDIMKEIVDWAAGIKPFGQRMVRDAVPRILKEKGHDLRFRRVEKDERPLVLKNKIEEVGRRLRMADRTREEESVVDLLEATEAFIRERGWDKSTLQALKSGRWKTRGGYEEGWIVEGDGAEP